MMLQDKKVNQEMVYVRFQCLIRRLVMDYKPFIR